MCWQLGPKRGRSLQELFVYDETVKDTGEVLFQERHRMPLGLARGGTPRRAEGMARWFFRGTDGNLSWGSRESAASLLMNPSPTLQSLRPRAHPVYLCRWYPWSI